jgi:hypothetical protein
MVTVNESRSDIMDEACSCCEFSRHFDPGQHSWLEIYLSPRRLATEFTGTLVEESNPGGATRERTLPTYNLTRSVLIRRCRRSTSMLIKSRSFY